MDISKDKLNELYIEGLSASSIAKQYGLSLSQIYDRMKKYGIARRTPAQSNNLRFYAGELSFRPMEVSDEAKRLLQCAGLVLYWAEGSKRNKHTVDLANSDPLMIRLFLKLLRELYQIDEKRIRVLLYCYSNQSPDDLINYWSKLCKIPESQFTKPYIRHDLVQEKAGRMPHGLIHVRYSDKRLHEQIMSDMDRLITRMLGW